MRDTQKPRDPVVQPIEVDKILVGDRLRPVSPQGVDSLIASIEQLGVMKDAIQVRQRGRGDNKTLTLMAGGHRLEAAIKLGWETIPAKVWVDVTDDFAALMEVDDNLSGSDLTPLELAIFLARRKAIYERMYPETKRGGDRKSEVFKNQTEQSSFSRSIAKSRGVTERQIRKITAVGQSLTEDDVSELRYAFKPISLADLEALSKVADGEMRRSTIWVFRNSSVKTLRDALKFVERDRAGKSAPQKDPVEGAFKALSSAWSRAPKAVRKRFVAEESAELFGLLSEFDAGLSE